MGAQSRALPKGVAFDISAPWVYRSDNPTHHHLRRFLLSGFLLLPVVSNIPQP